MKSYMLPRQNQFDSPGAIKFILLICTFIFIFIPISVGTAADQASSPSFNCQKDNLTPVEKIICSDSELAVLDAEMSRLFESAKKGVPDKEKQDFIVDQRQWLKQRDIFCKIKKDTQIIGQAQEEKKTCLKNLYQARIKDLKTSSSDEWEAALNELARRIPTARNEVGTIDTSKLIFAKRQYRIADRRASGTYNPHNESVIESIKKHYVLTKAQISEISEFLLDSESSSLYREDIDQDGIKDLIIEAGGGKGALAEQEYLYYHVNPDKTITKMKGPDISHVGNRKGIHSEFIDSNKSLDFVQLNNKTYIMVVDYSMNDSKKPQPKTVIELFSLKSEKGRKGIGKIQIDYSSYFKGKLVKGNNPAFHVLEKQADVLARHFEQKDSPPLAISLMNNPAWEYKGNDAEKIIELISEEYGAYNFLKNESRCQLLDIDNDGKNEIVCHMVSKPKDTKYSRMIIVKMGPSGPLSYIDVDEDYPELGYIDDKLLEYYCCNSFGSLQAKGSEYFPLSDGKEYYIVKFGDSFGYALSINGNYILGIYRLKGGKIEPVDAMPIEPLFTIKDVTVLK